MAVFASRHFALSGRYIERSDLPLIAEMFKEKAPFDGAVLFLCTGNCAVCNVCFLLEKCLNMVFCVFMKKNLYVEQV